MIKLLKNWNYKKHAVLVGSLYTGIAATGNALLHKSRRMSDESINPVDYCRNMPKKQKIFNGLVAAFFVADMTVGYCLVRRLGKKLAD